MAYDEHLDRRIRETVSAWKNTSSNKMFGGICHLINGNMFGGVWKDHLIVRIGPEETEKALDRKHVKPFDITGRPMKGWVMVAPEGLKKKADLEGWLAKAGSFAQLLPPKKK